MQIARFEDVCRLIITDSTLRPPSTILYPYTPKTLLTSWTGSIYIYIFASDLRPKALNYLDAETAIKILPCLETQVTSVEL